uniref:Fibronectin type-III domain-containing protein n=1 Tax=Candidatus Kentrum sp. TC TaxID=2126339 RepID=A0A450YU18_9GAMM|nr:MAG: hypothetical protein BECKTC1821D_GA0114238_102312 [Candidatus Kentron sp. TC]
MESHFNSDFFLYLAWKRETVRMVDAFCLSTRYRMEAVDHPEQPNGERLAFCVVAINKAGEGKPSNEVLAVLQGEW